jgi:carboxymethylenebutenolidase
MCFAPNASPPFLPADLAPPPMAGGAPAERLELTSADGTRFAAALAEAADPSAPAVLILPDVRGLYRFYVELAERFAQAGRHAIAIDYFGRTAGSGERDDEFDFMPHVTQTRLEQIQADAAAALDALAERTGTRSAVAVGFCFGGLQAFMAATSEELALDGVVGFYGSLEGGRLGGPKVNEHVSAMRCPVLGLFGEADEGIPLADVREFERRLAETKLDAEVVTYPGAPHSFFDRRQAEHAEASADAWRRVLGFLDRVGAATTA